MTDMVRFNGYPTTAGPSEGARPTRPVGPPSGPLPVAPPVGRPVPAPTSPPPAPPGPPATAGPAPGRARRRTAVALAVLAAVLLVAAGVFAYLYTSATGQRDALDRQLAERRGELTRTEDRVAATDAERQRAERANTALETENAELDACVDAVRHYLWDGLAGAERNAALDQLFARCR